jgi:hypothetical protein
VSGAPRNLSVAIGALRPGQDSQAIRTLRDA